MKEFDQYLERKPVNPEEISWAYEISSQYHLSFIIKYPKFHPFLISFSSCSSQRTY
jgi:hypothetical protein